MKTRKHSHKSGERVVPTDVAAAVEAILRGIDRPLRRRSAPTIRQEIIGLLHEQGWSDEVRINARRGLTLTAKLGKTALCLQTGNMARFYADLLKLQAQFVDGKITSGVYILPTRHAAKQMGDNMANFERLTSELVTLFEKVITIPLLIYGFDQGS